MNFKTILGTILTIFGAVALVYAGYNYINDAEFDFKDFIVAGILGLIFFTSGLGLIKQAN